jgi:DNA-binding winged helix-turn-helix (wHTH) protein
VRSSVVAAAGVSLRSRLPLATTMSGIKSASPSPCQQDNLLREVRGYRAAGSTRTVNSHARRLRRKLAAAGAEGWVRSSFGVGYRLAPDVHTAALRTVRHVTTPTPQHEHR